jgi:hypothetical protein
MALTARLTNPSYGYLKDGAVSYSCTLELTEDASGTPTVVATTGLSCTTNLTPVNGVYTAWVDQIKAEIKQRADDYIAQYKVLMQLVNIPYPTAVVPQDAINALALAIEPTITV